MLGVNGMPHLASPVVDGRVEEPGGLHDAQGFRETRGRGGWGVRLSISAKITIGFAAITGFMICLAVLTHLGVEGIVQAYEEGAARVAGAVSALERAGREGALDAGAISAHVAHIAAEQEAARSQASAVRGRLQLRFVALGLLTVVTGVAFAFATSRVIARPVRYVAEAARRLAAGDLTIGELTVRSRDEARDMAFSL